MSSSGFTSYLLAPWVLLWACIRSWLGFVDPVRPKQKELSLVSRTRSEPPKSTVANVRDLQDSHVSRSSKSPVRHAPSINESTPRPSHNTWQSSPATPTPTLDRSVSSQASSSPITPSCNEPIPTVPSHSKPYSPPTLNCASPVMVLNSGAQDVSASVELGALAQRRGFRGSPIVIDQPERFEQWKASKGSTISNDSFTEPNTPATSRSLKAKFGSLLRPGPSAVPSTPLSPLCLAISEDVQKDIRDADPFSMNGDSYFAPDISWESSNGSFSRSAMYDIDFYSQLSADQERRKKKKGKKAPPSTKHTTVNIYDSSIYDFGIGISRHSTPVQDKKAQRAQNRRQHEKASSTTTHTPSEPCGQDSSERPLHRSTTTRRYCIVIPESETRRMEVEALV
ncbi:hypothetical protein OE88DRAFT_1657750 [Heliocybe sulcata]|uniref:Uncharacterized protein n=1 Tax=Heliocybe sulcata TaxID=5364 RepID=A0A5C3N5Y5_9AGAM|nr:hypothetical protein OE88DRAFT_1657750 [Heliocybe sulcata]